MHSDEYPNTAIVSMNPIRGDQSNGMLMRSLFAGWPRDRLAQIYFPLAVTHLPDPHVCRDYRLIRPWGQVRRINGCAPDEIQVPARIAPSGSGSLMRSVVRAITRRRSLMRWLRPCIEAWGAQSPMSRLLERELRDLRPDCVYALLGNLHLTKMTLVACRRLNIPLYIHVTDDFVTALYRDVPLASVLQAASDRWFRRAAAYAVGLAAISPAMADEFAHRYGRPWSWFTTLIDPAAYQPEARSADGMLRLVYAGNLGLGRWRTLRELALALGELRKRSGPAARLAIYSADDQLTAHRRALDVPDVTELCGWAPPKRLPHIFHAADVLVHVESFDAADADYTKLSFSTKLSQYMMAARPILAIGPKHLASMRMIRSLGAGISIDAAQAVAIARPLDLFLRDGAARHAYGVRARTWAIQWVDQRSGTDRFRRELVRAVDHHHSLPAAA